MSAHTLPRILPFLLAVTFLSQPALGQSESCSPGTPITTLPFEISKSGFYFLTGPLRSESGQGIRVFVDDVTIDLRGFALEGPRQGAVGIGIGGPLYNPPIIFPPASNLTIRNGSIRGWGTAIQLSGFGMVVENVKLTDNHAAIDLASINSRVESCMLRDNGRGIDVRGESCILRNNTISNTAYPGNSSPTSAISIDYPGGLVEGNVVSRTTGAAISVRGECIVRNNVCHTNQTGIVVLGGGKGSFIVGNLCNGNQAAGIYLYSGHHVVQGNLANANAIGIHVTSSSSGCLIDANSFAQNQTGIRVESTVHSIYRNAASANLQNYDIVPGNDLGPIGNAQSATSPWANLSN